MKISQAIVIILIYFILLAIFFNYEAAETFHSFFG